MQQQPKFWTVGVRTGAGPETTIQFLIDMTNAKVEGSAPIKLAGRTPDKLITVAHLNLRHRSNKTRGEGAEFRNWVIKQLRILARFLRAAYDAVPSAIVIQPGTLESATLDELAPVAGVPDMRRLNARKPAGKKRDATTASVRRITSTDTLLLKRR